MILTALLAPPGLVVGSCSCPGRPIDDALVDRAEPACVWLISPRGHRADGSSSLLQDEANRRNPTACLCLTQEEYDGLGDRLDRVGWPEEGTLLEELNELAYEECTRISELQGFIDDECLDYYQHGTWLKDVYFARDEWASGTPPGFTCDQ